MKILATLILAAIASAQPFTMTHNLVDDVVETDPGTAQCYRWHFPTYSTSQNTLWRAFNLSEFALGDITVQAVEFGIQEFRAPAFEGETEVTIELLQAPSASIPAFGYELKGFSTAQFRDQVATIVSMEIAGCIDAGSALVVAITPQDYRSHPGNVAWIGSNWLGETAPSYISAETCEIVEPTAFGQIAPKFEKVAVLMNIYGVEGHECCHADCDGSGVLDFFDFLCFQNAFAAGEPFADCDGSGALDFFDFLCFQNLFSAGC